MEQRTLRVGDVVDDYCPRERRITNHAIVALVENVIRQTRCTTCDAEHPYKEARVPRRRKKDETDALYEQVLADVPGSGRVTPAGEGTADRSVTAASGEDEGPQEAPAADAGAPGRQDPPDAAETRNPADDLWPGHRRLIRAALPKSDGDPPAPRPIPEFTMHQRQRGGHYPRHAQHARGGHGQGRNGFRPGRSGNGPADGGGQPAGPGGRPHRQGGRPGRSRGHGRRSR